MVKLNIYHKPNKQRYATKFHIIKEKWEKLNGSKLRDEELKKVKSEMNALQTKAEKVIDKIESFSFVAFEESFF